MNGTGRLRVALSAYIQVLILCAITNNLVMCLDGDPSDACLVPQLFKFAEGGSQCFDA